MTYRSGKILLLSWLALFVTGFLFVSCNNKKKITTESIEKKQLWTCSMHPEIIRDQPGTCPICGMDLVLKVDNAVSINNIELNDLLQPTDRFVVSSVPVTTVKRNSGLIEIDALGSITYDTRLINTISARVSGRIEKLYVKYRYQHIMKGQRIMDIYSPELLTTQQELLFLLKNDADNPSLINAARQKLLLLGMSESQLNQIISSGKPSLTVAVYSRYSGHIHEAGNTMPQTRIQPGMAVLPASEEVQGTTEELLIKEGMYVQRGQNIFQVYDVSRSWVLLNIFPEFLGLINTGDAVVVYPETAASKKFRAKIDFIEPLFRKENKTMTARVYFDNSRLQIPIGSQVKATIFVNAKEANWLPKDAVLSLGLDKIVFLKVPGGFKAYKVVTGLTYKNQVQVISGLTPSDSVAADAQYLTDSESFIKVNNQP